MSLKLSFKYLRENIQELTNATIKKIDDVLADKETDLMEV